MRKIVFFIAVIGLGISASAQSDSLWLRYDSLQCDTLQTYPYLYTYNLPDTARYHDGMPCSLVDVHLGMPGCYTDVPGRFAVFQYTESPLTVYGIAFRAATGGSSWNNVHNLTVYDTAMNVIATDTAATTATYSISSSFWTNVDTTKFHFFTLPGKAPNIYGPLTDKIFLQFKYFDSNNPPIVLNGGFWVGISWWGGPNVPPNYSMPYRLHEDHEPPYRINNVRVKYSNYGDEEWQKDSVLEGILPELFLIVAPPCPAVDGLTAVMDSAGTVEVSWDSTDTHREWVVEMYGPDLTVTDTVASCHWRHTGLYPSKPYWVKVNARCPGPDNHVWSGWSPRVHFGAPVSVDAAEAALPGLVLSPNPTDGLVTVSADCVGETVTVSVMNGGGKEVMDLGNVALPVTFDTKGLAAGVYLVRVTTPRGTATRRLVVQ